MGGSSADSGGGMFSSIMPDMNGPQPVLPKNNLRKHLFLTYFSMQNVRNIFIFIFFVNEKNVRRVEGVIRLMRSREVVIGSVVRNRQLSILPPPQLLLNEHYKKYIKRTRKKHCFHKFNILNQYIQFFI